MNDPKRRKPHRINLLDEAVAQLVLLITDRGAELTSGEFGIVVTLERGVHRRIRAYEMRTVDLAAE